MKRLIQVLMKTHDHLVIKTIGKVRKTYRIRIIINYSGIDKSSNDDNNSWKAGRGRQRTLT